MDSGQCREPENGQKKGAAVWYGGDWLIWKLTKGAVHVTDYSNASRTMLFNINTLQWDEEILKELDIPASMLPEAKPSSCIYGKTESSFLGGEIPYCGRGRRSAGSIVRVRPV